MFQSKDRFTRNFSLLFETFGVIWRKPLTWFFTILLQIPPTWALTLTLPTSSCAWLERTGRWPTRRPGSTRIQTYPSASRAGARFWLRRASIWGDITLRWTSVARARTLASPTRASTARAARATAASPEITFPGAFSGMDAPSPPGTATWKHRWTWRSSPASAFMWTTPKACYRFMGLRKLWRSSTSSRLSSWSLFTRLFGCQRRRMSWRWWHRGNLYDSKAHLHPPHLQAELFHQPKTKDRTQQKTFIK